MNTILATRKLNARTVLQRCFFHSRMGKIFFKIPQFFNASLEAMHGEKKRAR